MLGRLSGWLLIMVAIVTASADAVMALGDGPYESLATGDVWTLLSGLSPAVVYGAEGVPTLLARIGQVMMDLPAWVVLGPLGLAMLLVFRKRPQKRMMFRTRAAYR